MAKSDKKANAADQSIIAEAKKRRAEHEEALSKSRELMLDDIRFSVGNSDNGYQWPKSVWQDRASEGRPALTMNKLPQFINQVVNDNRANRPQIKIRPVDDGVDKDAAEVFNGIIRNIETTSNADVAYDTAVEYAARCGAGYFRVLTDYVDDESFDQDIIIKRIPDPLAVRFDHHSTEPDGCDATWAMIEEYMARDVYDEMFPDADATSWESEGVGVKDWVRGDDVLVCEYFRIKRKKLTLYLLVDGSTTQDRPEDDALILRERDSYETECEWFKLSGCHVLERTVIKCRHIPIYPVYGNEVFIEGIPERSGMVRNSKDSQRQYNYWASSETEMIALAPRAPFIGYTGQFQSKKWLTVNSKNHPYIETDPVVDEVTGTVLPLPQRQGFAGVPAGIVNAKAGSNQDIRETVGMYNASVGAPSSETSGKAIMAKQREGDTGTFHYSDNQARSIRRLGKDLIYMIPFYYDTPRIIRILGEDGKDQKVNINPDATQALQKIKDQQDKVQVIFNPGVGKYDVVVTTGPSFATRRAENAQNLIEMAGAIPAVANVASDLIARNLDVQGADELADRLRRTIPPEVLGNDEGSPEVPPQIQAVIQQIEIAKQNLEAQAQALQQKEQELGETEAKVQGEINQMQGQRAELAAKTQIAKLQIENMLLKASQEQDAEQIAALEGIASELTNALNQTTDAINIPEVTND